MKRNELPNCGSHTHTKTRSNSPKPHNINYNRLYNISLAPAFQYCVNKQSAAPAAWLRYGTRWMVPERGAAARSRARCAAPAAETATAETLVRGLLRINGKFWLRRIKRLKQSGSDFIQLHQTLAQPAPPHHPGTMWSWYSTQE